MNKIIKKIIRNVVPPDQLSTLAILDRNLKIGGIYTKMILFSRPIRLDDNSGYELHLLTCKRDVLMALWCLKTFYYYSELRMPLFIHDDGTLTEDCVSVFKKHFIGCRVSMKKDADAQMRRHLSKYEYCSKYRFGNYGWSPLAIKLFDFIHYSRTMKILTMDSDVLFLRKPKEIIECIKSGRGFFMNDIWDSYSVPNELIKKLLNIQVRNNVNIGIMGIPAGKIYDLDLIELFLSGAYEKGFGRDLWTDQTAWAVFASKYKDMFDRLPKTYQISEEPITDRTVSHHFVSGVNGGSRDDFYKRGVRHLKQVGFLSEFRKRMI